MRLSVAFILVMLLTIPLVVAVPTFPANTQVSSVLTISNPLRVNLSVAVYMGYNVTSGPGNASFKFKPSVYLIKNWTSGGSMSLPYTVECSKPGNYTLNLVFKGIGTNGRIYRFTVPVSFRIVRNPVKISRPILYVQGSPAMGNVFNGENVTVAVSITNLASVPVPTKVKMVIVNGSSILLTREKSLTLFSGSKTVRFSFVVPWSWGRGKYRVTLTAISEYGNVSSSRDFEVSPGVSLVNVSLQRSEVFVGQENTLYVTLLSRRALKVNLTVNGKTVKSEQLSVGSSLIEVPLNASEQGVQRLSVEVLHGSLVLGASNVSYISLARPFFSSVNSSATPSSVSLNVTIVNPNDVTVSVELLENVSGVVTSPYTGLVLKPGRNVVHLKFTGVRPNSTVHFRLELLSSSLLLASKTGTISVPPLPKPSSSSEASSSTLSSVTSTTRGNATVGWRWAGAISALVIILVFVLIVLLRSRRKEEGYVSPWERARKPHVKRKWPSKRSPLGKFRKPEPPEVREGREIPKSGEKKRTGEGRGR